MSVCRRSQTFLPRLTSGLSQAGLPAGSPAHLPEASNLGLWCLDTSGSALPVVACRVALDKLLPISGLHFP